MPFKLQMLHSLMDSHPDRAEALRRHVEALEFSIESQPAFCLQNVRTLFEAAHATVAPLLGVTFNRNDGFPVRMRGLIQALDFSIAPHPEAAAINQHLGALMQGINDTAVALARLSNITNMRHGGSLDWGTLERQHAVMLGGLCDTLVSFLFEVAWRRAPAQATQVDAPAYEELAAFNAFLDEEHGDIAIAGSVFAPSRVLFSLDPTQYEAAWMDWATAVTDTADVSGVVA